MRAKRGPWSAEEHAAVMAKRTAFFDAHQRVRGPRKAPSGKSDSVAYLAALCGLQLINGKVHS